MRAPGLLLTVLAASACTQVPVADDLELADAELDDSRALSQIPNARRAEVLPDPVDVDAEAYAGPPRLHVSAFDTTVDETEADGTALCPFVVQAEGFPAVSEDGSTVAYHVAETLSSSDGEDEIVTVRWLDVATDTIETATVVVDGMQFEAREDHCRLLWRRARLRAAQVNARLSETRWRSLERVPIDVENIYEFDDVERSERVQLVHRGAEAIVRIRGVKVLERRAVDWYAVDDEACDFSPLATAVYGDRHTGVAIAEVEQYAPPCFCYSETLFHVIDLSSATWDEVLRRNGDDARVD